jgi:hypothetical protein
LKLSKHPELQKEMGLGSFGGVGYLLIGRGGGMNAE